MVSSMEKGIFPEVLFQLIVGNNDSELSLQATMCSLVSVFRVVFPQGKREREIYHSRDI